MGFDVVFDDVVYWLQPRGGITTYWNELTSRVTAQDRKVHRIGFRQTALGQLPAGPKAHAGMQRMPVSLARYLDAPLPRVARKSPNTVFHSSYYRTPSHAGCATVVTVHDFTYERYRAWLPRKVHSWQKWSAICRADVVICISNATLRELTTFMPDVDEGRIVVVPHGVSDVFRPLPAVADGEAPYVLFVGDRSKYKRFDIAVNAVQRVRGMTLRFTGAAPLAEEKVWLDRELPGRWQHAGGVNTEQLNALYSAAFALIYPSDNEGFGLPVLEAMRAGCPVVCSKHSSLPEAGGQAALYASAQIADAYVAQLSRLQNDAQRQSCLKRGYIHSAKFTWDACADRTLEAYELALRLR